MRFVGRGVDDIQSLQREKTPAKAGNFYSLVADQPPTITLSRGPHAGENG